MGEPKQSLVIASIILDGFEEYHREFKKITRKASSRFFKREWRKLQMDSVKRLDLYKKKLKNTLSHLENSFPEITFQKAFWKEIKSAFSEISEQSDDKELAETYFNSVSRKIFLNQPVDDDYMFVKAGYGSCQIANDSNLWKEYGLESKLNDLIKSILKDFFPNYSFEDIERDGQFIEQAFHQNVPELAANSHLQIIDTLFYRNKAAYVIGRILSGNQVIPFILPVIHGKEGLYIDALVTNPEYVRIIFSYTRSYFMVETEVPSQMIAFLLSLMPGKDLGEVYNSIGYHKHGKTEQYRLLLEHIEHSTDQFALAPGVKGLVMTVFTLPSYNIVFKIIKDTFEPPKAITRREVLEKYKLVKKLDRVGRMADTHEFENFVLPANRISEELLQELRDCIPSQFSIEDNLIIFKHLYSERKSIPLNILLEEADTETALKAALDYGQSIKEMAAANIFPGDMLTKNFGLTRHGRCIFYDYDEITLLTQCNFRDKPKAETYEQIYASSPWYEIAPDDIFPEEFRYFMIGREDIKATFEETHGDLFKADYWIDMQNKIKEGQFLHAFPYPEQIRFRKDAIA
ncbi:bifunctional isocitrate dehydrogenase kinase/phosphatase [Peijinzhouia sedimentorum]